MKLQAMVLQFLPEAADHAGSGRTAQKRQCRVRRGKARRPHAGRRSASRRNRSRRSCRLICGDSARPANSIRTSPSYFYGADTTPPSPVRRGRLAASERRRTVAAARPNVARSNFRACSTFVFERQRDARAKGDDFAVFDFHVHLGDFGDTQIAQRSRRRFDRAAACIFPGFFTDADDVDDAIDALTGCFLAME